MIPTRDNNYHHAWPYRLPNTFMLPPLASLSLSVSISNPKKIPTEIITTAGIHNPSLDVRGSRGRRHNDSGNNTPCITVNRVCIPDPFHGSRIEAEYCVDVC